MNEKRHYRSFSPASTAAIVFFISVFLSAILIWNFDRNSLRASRGRVLNNATSYAQIIQSDIQHAMSAAYALAALVRQGGGKIADFEGVANAMLPLYPGVSHLELSPNGIVTQMVPLAGREKALGFNPLKDEVQSKEAILASDTGKLTMAGPLNLVEGGLAVIGRLPVFLDANDATKKSYLWGFTNVVSRFPDIIASARLTQLSEDGFSYELWRIDPSTHSKQIIDSSSLHSPADPVEAKIKVPNGIWTLSVAPANGWTNFPQLAVTSLLGLILSLLLALIAKLLVEAKARERKLETLVTSRTAQVVEREAANKELERALHQVQKMEALGQLTGGVAHDFNNILQVILSSLELSLKHLVGGTAVARYLQNAIAATEQGAKLTGQLLAFARRNPLRPEPLRLERLVGDMTSLVRRTLGESIAIELATSDELWTAIVDPNQLQNALLNLAINARDAMPNGGKLTIELSNSTLDVSYAATDREVTPGEYVLLAVTDTGTGMSADTLERVFEPFFTTKPDGTGTGLGLSMVYGFVKQSKGHIRIDSELGRGTTVNLYLPRTLEGEAAARPIDETKTERGNGETILVVEDEDGVRASVASQLVELGYRVVTVENGEKALKVLAGGKRFDLLFTDLVMPGGLNGRGLADEARMLDPALRVLYTSGYSESVITHQDRLDEGVDLLSKPYRRTQLAHAIRSALSSSTAAHAAPIITQKDTPSSRNIAG